MISKAYLSPSKIKGNLLKAIEHVSLNVGCYSSSPGIDFTRNRIFSASELMKVILNMETKSTSSELCDLFMNGKSVPTSSAFVQARKKLTPGAFRRVFRMFTDSIENRKTVKGYYLLAYDGSDIYIPRDKNDRETYHIQKGMKTGYNQLHLNALFDVLNQIYLDIRIDTHEKLNECNSLTDMIRNREYPDQTIITADRGMEKYNLIAACNEYSQKYLIRVKDTTSNGILKHIPLPDGEFDVDVKRVLTYLQTKQVKNNKQLYVIMNNCTLPNFHYLDENRSEYEMMFRVTRFKITEDVYECLITNLSREEFSLEELKELYRLRWEIEGAFRDLKYTIGLLHFHSRKQILIRQEIYAGIIMYNLSQFIVNNTAVEEERRRKYRYVLNFKTSVTIVRQYMRSLITEQQIAERIKNFLIPIRPGRKYVRNIRPSSPQTPTYSAA